MKQIFIADIETNRRNKETFTNSNKENNNETMSINDLDINLDNSKITSNKSLTQKENVINSKEIYNKNNKNNFEDGLDDLLMEENDEEIKANKVYQYINCSIENKPVSISYNPSTYKNPNNILLTNYTITQLFLNNKIENPTNIIMIIGNQILYIELYMNLLMNPKAKMVETLTILVPNKKCKQ
jgi:hypothetical protein